MLPEPTFTLEKPEGDLWKSAAEFNTLYSTFTSSRGTATILADAIDRTNRVREPGFNPWNHVEEFDSRYWDQLALVDSEAELEGLRQDIAKKTNAAQVLNNEGVAGILAGVASGVADPINLIPFGAFTGSIRAGESALRVAFKTGVAAAASSVATDAVLSMSDPTVDLERYATDASASFLLGGMLGGGGAALLNHLNKAGATQNNFQSATAMVDNEMVMTGDGTQIKAEQPPPGSVGAMKAELELPAGIYAANPMYQMYEKVAPNVTAGGIVENSQNPFAKRLLMGAVPRQTLMANEAGEAISNVGENVFSLKSMTVADGIVAIDDMVKIYKNVKPEKSIDEFKQDVGRWMTLNEIGKPPVIASPYDKAVADAAKSFYRVYEKAGNDLSSVGGTPVKGYSGPISLDKNRVVKDKTRFLELLKTMVKERNDEVFGAVDEARAILKSADLDDNAKASKAANILAAVDNNIPKTVNGIKTFLSDLDQRYRPAEDVAFDFYNKVLTARGTVDLNDFQGDRLLGHLYSRQFFTPQRIEKFFDFINMDASHRMYYYTNVMYPKIAEKKVFGPGGFDEAYNQAVAFYDDLASKGDAVDVLKEKDKVLRSLKSVIESVRASRARNVNGNLRDGLDMLKSFNIAKNLILAPLANVTEIGMIPMQVGFNNFVAGLDMKFTKNMSFANKRTARIIAGAVDVARAQHLVQYAGIDEVTQVVNPLHRGIKQVASVIYRPTSYLQDYFRMTAMNARLAEFEDMAGRQLTKRDMEYLKVVGMTESSLRNMDFYNPSTWTSEQQAAVANAIEGMTLTGRPDLIPEPLNNEVGGAIMQFRTYLLAANHKIAQANLQRPEQLRVSGLAVMFGLSAMGVAARRVIMGQPIVDEERGGAAGLVYEAWNNTGIGGLPGYLFDVFGAYGILGVDLPRGRYLSESGGGVLFGPTVTTANQVLSAASILTQDLPAMARGEQDEIRRQKLRDTISLLPGQSLYRERVLDFVDPKE